MTKPTKLLFLSLLFSSFLAGIQGARAEDPALNRDRLPSARRLARAQDYHRVQAWLEAAGLSRDDDSFVDGLVHVVMGVEHPIGRSVSLNLRAGPRMGIGVTF